jgi:hypothetical protein
MLYYYSFSKRSLWTGRSCSSKREKELACPPAQIYNNKTHNITYKLSDVMMVEIFGNANYEDFDQLLASPESRLCMIRS